MSQLAFNEVGKRRVPVSLLPGLARALGVSIETLVGDDGEAAASTVSPRRPKRGPPSKIERQLNAVAKLPKAQQKAVSTVLDAVLAQHQGQEAATTA